MKQGEQEKVSYKVMNIPLKEIHQIENSRLVYDENGLAELMVSLKQNGQLQPIGVKAMEHGGYEVVFGNRRTEAARKLGWSSIEACIVNAETEDEMIVLNAIENMQRESVPPAEQGRLFAHLINSGLTHTQIAVRVGVTPKKVLDCLTVFNHVPKELQERILAPRMGGAKKLSTPKGMLGASAAFGVGAISSKYKLTPTQQKRLFDFASLRETTHAHVRTVGYLMSRGMELDDAIQAAKEHMMVNIMVAIKRDTVQELEDKHNRGIHLILTDRLTEMDDLGILRVRQPKQMRRRSPKIRSRYFAS